jgi:hypothetical protein
MGHSEADTLGTLARLLLGEFDQDRHRKKGDHADLEEDVVE